MQIFQIMSLDFWSYCQLKRYVFVKNMENGSVRTAMRRRYLMGNLKNHQKQGGAAQSHYCQITKNGKTEISFLTKDVSQEYSLIVK